MENSSIEWTDHTINFWHGCTKVSPGCANCYAATMSHRWGKDIWGKGKPREDHRAGARKLALKLEKVAAAGRFRECTVCGLREERKWDDALPPGGLACCSNPECVSLPETESFSVRPRVFCASMSDWLDDEVPVEWLADLLKTIYDTPNLDWLLLTKRPELWLRRMGDAYAHLFMKGSPVIYWLEKWRDGQPPANVWIGTTVEDQARADERIPKLLEIPARVRFLSCEPMLSAIDLTRYIGYYPMHEREIRGDHNTRSSEAGPVGDRCEREHLEGCGDEGQSLALKRVTSTSSEAAGRARSRAVSPGAQDDRGGSGVLFGASSDMASLLRTHSSGSADQPQERGQKGQSAGEPRGCNAERKLASRVQGRDAGSTRPEESISKADRFTGSCRSSDVSNGIQDPGSDRDAIPSIASSHIQDREGGPTTEAERPNAGLHKAPGSRNEPARQIREISWAIVGGESGHGARPMHPDWARSLRDQCAAAGVPFFFKQWGEWAPCARATPGEALKLPMHGFDDGTHVVRVGKLKAGRLLDGVEHSAFPIALANV